MHYNNSNNVNNRRLFLCITVFPSAYIWFAIVSGNTNMRVFYVIYFLFISVLFFSNKKRRIKKRFALLLSLITIKLLYDLFSFPGSASDAIELAILYIILYIAADPAFRDSFYQFLIGEELSITIVYVIYFLGVMVSFLTGIAITNRWGTISIEGPYGLPHIFSYELLIIATLSFLIWEKIMHARWMIFFVISLILVLMTTVRTTLLCFVIILSYYFLAKRGWSKFLYALAGVTAVFLIFRFTPLFSHVLEKTNYAIVNGSITNFREEIWGASFQHFINSPWKEKLLGSGIDSLMNWNLSMLRLKIQAHNDFLTVLSSFGLISLAVYVILLLRISRKAGGIGFLLAVTVLIMYNGLYSYCSFVIGIPIFRLFFDRINPPTPAWTGRKKK